MIKQKKSISIFLVLTMILVVLFPTTNVMASETVINGEVDALVIKMSITPTVEWTIDPNNENEEYFTSSILSMVNNSTAPVKISIIDATASTTLTDVLPDHFEDWTNLGKKDSENIALGLNSLETSEFREQIATDTIYIKELTELFNTPEAEFELGSINANKSIMYSLTANHGLAFQSAFTNTNTLSFGVELAD